MSTVYLVMDWATLLYFCLSTMFAAIVLLFFASKKPGLMRFAAINWGISNIGNAGWDFVSDQVLQRDLVNLWLSLGQLLLAILALTLAIGFAIIFKEAEKEDTEFVPTILSQADSDNSVDILTPLTEWDSPAHFCNSTGTTDPAPLDMQNHVGPQTSA